MFCVWIEEPIGDLSIDHEWTYIAAQKYQGLDHKCAFCYDLLCFYHCHLHGTDEGVRRFLQLFFCVCFGLEGIKTKHCIDWNVKVIIDKNSKYHGNPTYIAVTPLTVGITTDNHLKKRSLL